MRKRRNRTREDSHHTRDGEKTFETNQTTFYCVTSFRNVLKLKKNKISTVADAYIHVEHDQTQWKHTQQPSFGVLLLDVECFSEELLEIARNCLTTRLTHCNEHVSRSMDMANIGIMLINTNKFEQQRTWTDTMRCSPRNP